MISRVPTMTETSPVARLLTWATTGSASPAAGSSAVGTSGVSPTASRLGTAASIPSVATFTDVCLKNPRRVSFAISLSSHRDIFDPYDIGIQSPRAPLVRITRQVHDPAFTAAQILIRTGYASRLPLAVEVSLPFGEDAVNG